MVTVKSLLSFLVDVDGKKIICFYDQESHDLISSGDLGEDEKKQVLAQIQQEIFAPVLKPSTLSLALPRLALNSPASSPSKTANLEIIAMVIYLQICPF